MRHPILMLHRGGHCQPPNRRLPAFTLIEVLVSMTVLVILIVCVSQLTSSTASTVIESRKYIDADSQARLIFGRMSVEFSNMLQRPDVDFSTFKNPGNSGMTSMASPSPAPSLAPNLQGGSTLTGGTNAGPNDQLAFYTQNVGYYQASDHPGASTFTGSQRAPMSLVAYSVQADQTRLQSDTHQPGVIDLQRVGKALGWDPDPSGTYPAAAQPTGGWQSVSYLPVLLTNQWTTLFNADVDSTSVGDQVFRFEYTYLLKANTSDPVNSLYPASLSTTPWWTAANKMASGTTTQHTSINAFSDVAAIVVAIAVLDPASHTIVSSSAMPTLIAALPDAVDSAGDTTYHGDILSNWTHVISDPGFAASVGIPKSAAGSIRVYQRYFYLDGH